MIISRAVIVRYERIPALQQQQAVAYPESQPRNARQFRQGLGPAQWI